MSYGEADPHLPPAPCSASVPRCTIQNNWVGCPIHHHATAGTCHKALAHGDARQLPASSAPLGMAKGLEVTRQRWQGAEGGGASKPGLCHSAPCWPGWGVSSKRGPLGRYQEKHWQPVLARGQAREGRCPRAPRAFLFWQAPGAPLSAPPVLLPRPSAGIQLNQCSANNLPANKTFSSLSLLPPTPPQSVCDGSALI